MVLDRLNLTEEATEVAEFMNKMWGNFAHNEKPSEDSNVWPTYSNGVNCK